MTHITIYDYIKNVKFGISTQNFLFQRQRIVRKAYSGKQDLFFRTFLLSAPSVLVSSGHDTGRSFIRASVLRRAGHVVLLSHVTKYYSCVTSVEFTNVPVVIFVVIVTMMSPIVRFTRSYLITHMRTMICVPLFVKDNYALA